VIATGMSGPRRYGYGTIRDYVIGIEAIDGRGTVFHAGGRVVKNVAGYDFCKLLTGSYGTLGLITHVTLKVRPRPETMAVALCETFHPKMAETLIDRLITHSVLTPVGLEFCTQRDQSDGTDCPFVAVLLEGSQAEVDWQLKQWELAKHGSGIGGGRTLVGSEATEQWSRFVEFAAAGSVPLMLKFGVPSSQLLKMTKLFLDFDPTSLIEAHAGNGIVLARLPGLEPAAAARALVSHLRPAAAAVGGHVTVWDTVAPQEFTSQAMWGSVGSSLPWMRAVKQQFDPHGIFNPGRFVYGD
jgi:glycolate oxidase FAD binding subunit